MTDKESKDSTRPLESVLAGLPGDVRITRHEVHEHTVELFVEWDEPKRGERRCPACGSGRCVVKDGGAMQTVRHTHSGMLGTLVTFHKPRFICRDCGRTFYMRPGWVLDEASITTGLLLEIATALTSTTHCVSQIAKETHSSPAIVRNIIRHTDIPKPARLPETLGIDELHGNTGTYNRERRRFDTEKYHCVITDPDGGFVMDMLYKATFHELHEYFMDYHPILRQNVKFFCTDMRGGFSKVARACFPNARICIDHFHVKKLINEAVSAIRTDSWRGLAADAAEASACARLLKEGGDAEGADEKAAEAARLRDDATLVKNSQRILVTSPFNERAYWNRHPEKRDARLAEIYALAPGLKLAREALEAFHVVAAEPSFGLRRAGLTEWLDKYLYCGVPEIEGAARSIKKHRRGIEDAWRFGKSNGATEGLNRKIKDCRRLAFGAHDFESFRKRALLACGETTIPYVSYTVFGEKRNTVSDGSAGLGGNEGKGA